MGVQMRILLAFALFIILLLLGIVLELLYKNRSLNEQIQSIEDINLWHRLAFTDNLTGIYNRTAYSKHISEIEKLNTTDGFGIMLFDIDNFKAINDTRGHLAGDTVLQYVAGILLKVFSSPKYSVYRIGGDEFAVIAKNTTEKQIVAGLINLKNVLEKDSDIRLSKGYSIIQGSVKDAFADADKMLYADKAAKK